MADDDGPTMPLPRLGDTSTFKGRLYAYGSPADEVEDRRADAPMSDYDQGRVKLRYAMNRKPKARAAAESTGRLSNDAGLDDIGKFASKTPNERMASRYGKKD